MPTACGLKVEPGLEPSILTASLEAGSSKRLSAGQRREAGKPEAVPTCGMSAQPCS